MRPPGWPSAVPDPDDPAFVEGATRWLWDVGRLDRAPASLWGRHPRALAFRVACELEARLEGLRSAYARTRVALADADVDLPAVLVLLEHEAAQVMGWQREVELVQEALAGRRWTSRL